nr:hypothetical protein [Streptomyces xiaopingdaonensis]
MGWTHDYRDVARKRSRPRGTSGRAGVVPPIFPPPRPYSELGIPRILRRRARWVGARLRHMPGPGGR